MTCDAQTFAISAHGDQLYGQNPYAVHLAAVAQIITEAGYDRPYLDAAWLHDVIEDTQVTLEAIEDRYGSDVAAMVDACTGLGNTRADRNARIYAGIAAYPRAAVVKLADRIANVEAAPADSHHMKRYVSEMEGFASAVMPHVPPTMWARLEAAISKPYPRDS